MQILVFNKKKGFLQNDIKNSVWSLLSVQKEYNVAQEIYMLQIPVGP